jgi:tripeptide aminopeptidase
MSKINEKRAIDLVMQLMAVRGPSCEETAVADFIVAKLLALGIDKSAITFDSAHKRTPRPGALGNLIVKLPGTRKGPRVLLSAHMDTVPICLGCKPKRVGNVIRSADPATGLGGDDRAGIAAVLTGVTEVMESETAYPPLTICFFVQEEIGLQGSRNLDVKKLGKPAFGFNFDGGNPRKLTIGATGGERMKIKLFGIPAHAGLSPQDGASAITAAGIAIAALHKEHWLGLVKKKQNGNKVASLGTSNVGIIHGGNATNVVTDYVEIDAEARSHDSAFRTAIADAMEAAFVKAASQVKSASGEAVRAEIERRVDYDSFRLAEDSPVVQQAADAVRSSTGVDPELAVTNGGVDANWLYKHGIPSVTMGCGQRDVHTNQETLDIPDYLAACRITKSLLEVL